MSAELLTRLEEADRKAPYHSDLASVGEVELRFDMDPRKSKYPDRTDDYPGKPAERLFTKIEVRKPGGGTAKLTYEPDTDRVAEAIRRVPKNTWVRCRFDGVKEDADLVVHDGAGNLIVDSRDLDRAPPRTAEGGVTESPEAAGGQPWGEAEHDDVTVADLQYVAMMNASAVLGRVTEDLDLVPEHGLEEPGHVGWVPATDWLRMCKEMAVSMIIRHEQTGLPIGPYAGGPVHGGAGSEGQAGAGSDAGGKPRDPNGKISTETRESLGVLAQAVSMDETTAEWVGRALKGGVTEQVGQRLLERLTEMANEQANGGAKPDPAKDPAGGVAGEEDLPW